MRLAIGVILKSIEWLRPLFVFIGGDMELTEVKDYLVKFLPTLGYKLYGYKVSKEGNTYVLHVIVDRRNYIDLNEISLLSNSISEKLSSEIKEDFVIDCASAGVEKEISKEEINDYLNEKVSLSLNHSVNKLDKIIGIVNDVNGDSILLEVNISGKKKSIEVKKEYIAHINLAI